MKTMTITEKELVLIRRRQLVDRLINNVDNPNISDANFNSDLLKLCVANKLIGDLKDKEDKR